MASCGKPPIFSGGGAATSTSTPPARTSGSTTTATGTRRSSSRTGTVTGGASTISATGDPLTVRDIVLPHALEQIDRLELESVEMTSHDDDVMMLEALDIAGFEFTGEVAVATWMHAVAPTGGVAARRGVSSCVSQDRTPPRAHHMIPRNGEHVAARLAECSLYRAELDLAVYAPDGEVASYGLFWADPVTGVGLVEPMRTEDAYQGLGLARHVLTSGLDRLAALGCSSLKVSYLDGNDAARHLYLGTGFRPEAPSRTYGRHR